MISFIVSCFSFFTRYRINSVQCSSVSPASLSICPEYCLPLNACTPVRRGIPPRFCQPWECLVVGPTPEELVPASHCMGFLCSVQAVSSCAPTSLSFQASKVVPLPFAYLATHLVNITLCFLLALQIHIFAILVFFSFFLSYSILLFLRVNLG